MKNKNNLKVHFKMVDNTKPTKNNDKSSSRNNKKYNGKKEKNYTNQKNTSTTKLCQDSPENQPI